MYGGPTYAAPQGSISYGAAQAGPYYAQGGQQLGPQYGYEGTALASRKPPPPRRTRKRMNLLAIGLSYFIPWLLFCLIFAMLSFQLHYARPHICTAIAAIVGVAAGGMVAMSLLGVVRKTAGGEGDSEAPSWVLFFWSSMLLALLLAVYFGNRNYWTNMQPHFDLLNLNTYTQVDPALQRGQEFMDAAQVMFNPNVTLDLTKATGFKNSETYCVVPITGGIVNNAPLNSYDFWAVGKNCCTGSNAADFHCGEMQSATHGGVRVVRDEDRAFYRLAVQQAESAYAIRAIHPLFFHWVSDPTDHVDSYRREGYKVYLIGMLAYLGFQLVLVLGNIYVIKERVFA